MASAAMVNNFDAELMSRQYSYLRLRVKGLLEAHGLALP
jgi:hypothetical protein